MDFADLLAYWLDKRGLSQVAFAKLAGDHGPQVNAVVKRARGVPLARVESWADALNLDGEDRAAFLAAAVRQRVPVASAFLDQQGAGVEATVRQVRESVEDYKADLLLPVVGRAAAAKGAHVDGETAEADPVTIRARWRVHVIHGSSGEPVVLPGQSVLTDPTLKPRRNRLVILPGRDGVILKRWGEVHGESVVVASIDGHDPRLVPLAEIGQPEVVVGVLFTDSVAR